MSTLQTTIEWESRINAEDTEVMERSVVVEYSVSPGSRGRRGSCGEPLEPDEPPSVELLKVLLSSPTAPDRNATEDILDELTTAQRDRLEGLCMENESEG